MSKTGTCLSAVIRAAAVAACLLASPAAGRDEDDRDLITAAFVYNFCKFVDWPGESEDTLRLGVLSSSPSPEAFNSIDGKSLGSSNLKVVPLSAMDGSQAVHAVFIPAERANEATAIIAGLGDRPVLTISDGGDFCRAGGIIEMTTVDNKIRFSINADAARESGLTISSQLMKMAVEVIGGR